MEGFKKLPPRGSQENSQEIQLRQKAFSSLTSRRIRLSNILPTHACRPCWLVEGPTYQSPLCGPHPHRCWLVVGIRSKKTFTQRRPSTSDACAVTCLTCPATMMDRANRCSTSFHHIASLDRLTIDRLLAILTNRLLCVTALLRACCVCMRRRARLGRVGQLA